MIEVIVATVLLMIASQIIGLGLRFALTYDVENSRSHMIESEQNVTVSLDFPTGEIIVSDHYRIQWEPIDNEKDHIWSIRKIE